MNTPSLRMAFTTAAVMFVTAASAAWASDEVHGRISYSTDEALILGQGEDDWSFAGINTLVLEGDRVWADNSGAIEIEFQAGHFVRLADGSEIEIVNLAPDGMVRGWVGSFYVERLDPSSGEFVFDSGAAMFEFDEGTVARFDILTDGATTLSVVQGRVMVDAASGREMSVGSGYRIYIDPGFLPSAPERFRSDDDTFDVWNETRVAYYSDYLDDTHFRDYGTAPAGVRDLRDYGAWVYVDNSYYWRPIHVASYVPYRQGRWSYVPAQGYVWVGYYPFDYVTAHYGYWSYHGTHGWLWQYEPVYAPARVASIYYGDVLFWSPCDRSGYPVYGTAFDLTIGGFRFSYASSSYAYFDFVYYRQPSNYYYVQPLGRTVLAAQRYDAQPMVWAHHSRTNLDYWAGVERNAGVSEFRSEPERRMRGFDAIEARGEAGAVAATLQETRGRKDFAIADRGGAPSARTSNDASARHASVRDIATVSDRGIRVETPQPESSRIARSTTPRETSAPSEQRNPAVKFHDQPMTDRGSVSTPPDRSRGKDRSVSSSTTPPERNEPERATLPTDRGQSERSTPPAEPGKTDRGAEPNDRDQGERGTLPADRGQTRQSTAPSERKPADEGNAEHTPQSSESAGRSGNGESHGPSEAPSTERTTSPSDSERRPTGVARSSEPASTETSSGHAERSSEPRGAKASKRDTGPAPTESKPVDEPSETGHPSTEPDRGDYRSAGSGDSGRGSGSEPSSDAEQGVRDTKSSGSKPSHGGKKGQG